VGVGVGELAGCECLAGDGAVVFAVIAEALLASNSSFFF